MNSQPINRTINKVFCIILKLVKVNCLSSDSFSATSLRRKPEQHLHFQLHGRPDKSQSRKCHDGHIPPRANVSLEHHPHLDPSLPRLAHSFAGEGAYSQKKNPSKRSESRWPVVHLQHEEPRRVCDATPQYDHRIHRSGVRWTRRIAGHYQSTKRDRRCVCEWMHNAPKHLVYMAPLLNFTEANPAHAYLHSSYWFLLVDASCIWRQATPTYANGSVVLVNNSDTTLFHAIHVCNNALQSTTQPGAEQIPTEVTDSQFHTTLSGRRQLNCPKPVGL